jgi:SAM-dependent methyltransferase
MVRHRFFASEVPSQTPEDLSSLTCHVEYLPLPNCSVDAMVLHHALETARDPRAALREAARVLVPGARLVLCAFNPLSLWGMRGACATIRSDSFSGLRMVNTIRLRDWLAVLGFELQSEIKYLAYGLPFGTGAPQDQPGRVRRLVTRMQPPVGGVYLMSVLKQAMARRGIGREVPLPSPKLVPVAYPKASVSRVAAPVFELRQLRTSGLRLAGRPRPGAASRTPAEHAPTGGRRGSEVSADDASGDPVDQS